MSSFVVTGGKQLSGEIEVHGSKNAALPLIAASLLTDKGVRLQNIPDILDVQNMLLIAEAMGVRIDRDGSTVKIVAQEVDASKLPRDLVGRLRGSILLLGALLGRGGVAKLPYPGGDIIGARPIDVHLDAFAQLGAEITEEDDVIAVNGKNMKAGHVVLKEFSVTATENVLLAAANLPGKTTIDIAASEPHVVALANMLTQMGAEITGAGTHHIEVEGNTELKGADFTNIPDMLEAGLFMLIGAATQSEVVVKNVPVADLRLFFKKLDEVGVKYEIDGSSVRVKPHPIKSFKLQTMPQPGIATDLQAPFSVIATQAPGATLIHDPLYESRFRHCDELKKMGATVTVCDPHRVIIEGPTPLFGKKITSLDIRSGATLVMAGLLAKGETVIDEAEIIDRGYERLDERLRGLGVDIRRV